MTIINYRKVKSDECGKEEEIKDGGTKPSHWLEINIFEWFGNSGTGRFTKEVCSEKCALELMKKIKEIPKEETNIY